MNLENRKAGEGGQAINEAIKIAKVTIESLDKSVLHIRMDDAEKQCWEAPLLNSRCSKKIL